MTQQENRRYFTKEEVPVAAEHKKRHQTSLRTGREAPSPAAARDVRARRSLRRLVSTRGCRRAHSSHCHSARGQPMWLQRARS